jgi:carbonyl reductase 1
LTARDELRGAKALEALRNDEQLKKAKALRQDGGLTDIAFHKLDISDQVSIHNFWLYLCGQHHHGVDILINNAAVALDGFSVYPFFSSKVR